MTIIFILMKLLFKRILGLVNYHIVSGVFLEDLELVHIMHGNEFLMHGE